MQAETPNSHKNAYTVTPQCVVFGKLSPSLAEAGIYGIATVGLPIKEGNTGRVSSQHPVGGGLTLEACRDHNHNGEQPRRLSIDIFMTDIYGVWA